MRTLLFILLCGDYIFLLMIGSMQLSQYRMSEFAFKDRVKDMPAENARRYRRLYKLLPEVKLLQQVELVTAGSIFVVLLLSLYSPLVGLAGALVAFASIKMLSRIKYMQAQAARLFESTLDVVLKTTDILSPLWWLLGKTSREYSGRAESTDEFIDQLGKLPSVILDSKQKQRVQAVLESQTKTVKSVMTAKRSVTSVKPHATLGPVLLSDLQKTGHGYFPVYENKAEPEGILDIGDLGDIQSAKQRQTVRDIMDSQLIWVEEETSLEELVQAFLQEKQYMLFVRNLDGDFTGIVTIADLLKQLIGVVKD